MKSKNSDRQLREEKISSKTVYRGNLLDLHEDKVRLPSGESATREYVTHQGAAAVLPVYENGEVMLVRQFRYPLDRVFLEVPAGKIDPDEDPATTASRELREETGITCREYKELGHFFPSIGYTDEIIYLYLGWNIEESAQQIDEEEFLHKQRLSFREAHQMVIEGEITDSKTALILLKAAHWWRREAPFDVNL